MIKEHKITILSVLLIAVLGFAVYANSLKGEFIWDDFLLVKDNNYIKSPSYLLKLFTTDIGEGAESEFNFYRPLQMLSYMLDYSLWKLNPLGYHVSNIFFHLLAAVSLYFFILLLFKEKLLSLLCSVLFVIHPVHSEAVTYISGRADSLAAAFVFLTLFFYLKCIDSRKLYYYIFMVTAYICGLLSRENSLFLPLILIFYHFVFRKRINLKGFLSIISVGIIYIFLRVTIFKSFLSDISSCPTTLLQRIPGFLAAIIIYLKLLIFPFNLHMEYGDITFPWTNPRVILGAFLALACIVYVFRKGRSQQVVVFSLGWFFITLLPHSNLYPINAYMAEHWLYLPSVGFFLIVANFFIRLQRFPRFQRFQRISLAFFIILTVFYSILTVRQNNYWQEPVGFYKRTLKYAPQSARMHYNLGWIYYEAGKKDEAILSYERAVEINPKYAKAYYNLGIAYYHEQRIEDSIAAFNKAIKARPDYAKAYYNLGNAYSDIQKYSEAVASYARAIEINPSYFRAYNNLGIVYNDLGRYPEAIEIFQKAIEFNPESAEVHYNLGNSYSFAGNAAQAVASFEEAIELKPDYVDAYNNLGIAYYNAKKFDEAIDAYNKAVEFNPEYADAYNNLGNAYKAEGKLAQAIKAYTKAIAINPANAMAYNNLAVSYYHQQDFKLAVDYCNKAIELGYQVHPEFLELLRPYREDTDDHR